MYCDKCGKENEIGTKFCTNCGNSLDVSSNYVVKEEKSTFGWGILSFFVPIAGLILFILWKKEKPKTAKTSGICALLGVIFSIILFFFMIFKTAVPQITGVINDSKKSTWESSVKMIEEAIEVESSLSVTKSDAFDIEKVCISSNNLNITSEINKITDILEDNIEVTCAGAGSVKVTGKGQFEGQPAATITCVNGNCSTTFAK